MIYQGVVPYKYLCHDISHMLVSKYSENKSRVCAFVHKWSLTIYSVTHSIPVPMQVLGTGWPVTHSMTSVTHDSCTQESESEVTQSCPTLCDPMACSLPHSPFHGIFQSRVLEWVAISFSRGSSRPKEWNLSLPHCRQALYHLSHQGSPPLLFLEKWRLHSWPLNNMGLNFAGLDFFFQ